MVSSQTRIVALLGRNDDARAQLRSALLELGAKVAVEAETSAAQAAQVLAAGVNVVIVNLASGVDDDIDHLQALFDSPQVSVIFNEAAVSVSLEGWDLARWARHLAAKLFGHEDTLPPPPPGAATISDESAQLRPGAPPTPVQETLDRPIEEFVVEAETLADDVPDNHLPLFASQESSDTSAKEDDLAFDFDLSALETALVGEQQPNTPTGLSESGNSSNEESIELPEIEFDLDSLESLDEPVETPVVALPDVDASTVSISVQDEETIDLATDLATLELDLASVDFSDDTSPAHSPAESPAAAVSAQVDVEEITFDFGDISLDSLSFEDDATRITHTPKSSGLSFSSDSIDLDDNGLLDDDVAALAASLDALEKSLPQAPEVEGFSLQTLDDLPDDRPTPKPAPDATLAAPAKEFSFGNLSLADSDAPLAQAAPVKKPEMPVPGVDFGSLSLASLDDEPTPAAAPATPKKASFDTDFSSLSLAPISDDDGVDPLMVAMGLIDAPAKPEKPESEPVTGDIRRVIALGASIGGPDAVRGFLSAIPEGFPAVFLLVQHLESGYFERLAQQLQKSVKLPVSVLGAAKVTEGNLYVVPANARYSIAPDGAVTAEPHAAPPRYTPSIDNLFIDVANRFGSRLTAIIFSGMAGDAIEGAVQVAAKGGEVWVQDPSTCVVAAMVEGAQKRGVAEFTGSPRELGERLIQRYGKA